MVQAAAESRTASLEERLTRGAQLLFDMEQRGDTGEEYHRWLRGWLALLRQYERAQAA